MVFDWIAQHAPQILLVIITAVVLKVLDALFAKRAKVVWFYTNAATFPIPVQGNAPPVTVYTHTLALQNLGRAPAEEVKVVHNLLPAHHQVYPPQQTTVMNLPGGQQAIVIPRILPNQLVFIAYLDFVPPTPEMYSHVETKDHIANPMPVQIARKFPMWANWVFGLLMLLGAFVLLFYFFSWGTKLLRLVVARP